MEKKAIKKSKLININYLLGVIFTLFTFNLSSYGNENQDFEIKKAMLTVMSKVNIEPLTDDEILPGHDKEIQNTIASISKLIRKNITPNTIKDITEEQADNLFFYLHPYLVLVKGHETGMYCCEYVTESEHQEFHQSDLKSYYNALAEILPEFKRNGKISYLNRTNVNLTLDLAKFNALRFTYILEYKKEVIENLGEGDNKEALKKIKKMNKNTSDFFYYIVKNKYTSYSSILKQKKNPKDEVDKIIKINNYLSKETLKVFVDKI